MTEDETEKNSEMRSYRSHGVCFSLPLPQLLSHVLFATGVHGGTQLINVLCEGVMDLPLWEFEINKSLWQDKNAYNILTIQT